MTTKKLKLDVWKKNFAVVLAHKGESNSRFLEIIFVNGNSFLDLNKKTVVIYTKKPDGTVIFNDCDILDAQKGVIAVKLTSQMSSVVGNLNCEFQIVGQNSEILIVQGLTLKILSCEDDIPIQSTSEYAELVRQISELDNANQKTTELLKEYQTDNFATKNQGIKADSAVQDILGIGVELPKDLENKINLTPENIGASGINHMHEFNSLTEIPSTLEGYGITDASNISHTHEFDELKSKPFTLEGYGIEDAATKSQGIKADSAIQGIKVDGNIIQPDDENIVSISSESIDIEQTLGNSQTAIISQNASTTLLAQKIHSHKLDDLSNGYFVTVDTGAKNYISDMIEVPSRHYEMPPTIGMISADSTNGSFYLQTTDGLNYQKYLIQSSGTGYSFKFTYNSDNGKLYAISGQNVFTSYSEMPDYWEKQTTTSPHDVSSSAWYSYENGIFFLSAGNQSPTPSGLWKSTDSLRWELISTMKNGWYCCKWLNGAYWACGLGVYKSTDAITWEQIITPEQLGGSSKWAMNILYIGNKYVVMGDWGAKYLTSTDGATWTEITPNNPKPSSKFLMWDNINDVFGSVSNNIYYTSSDLINWSNIGSYSSYNSPNSFVISSGKVFIDYGQQYSGKIAVHNTELPFILPESNGGTGTTSLNSLKSNLGIPNVVQELGASTSNVMSQNSINSMIITTGSDLTPLDSRIYSSSYISSRFASLPHYHTSSEIIDDYKKSALSDSTSGGQRFVAIFGGYIYVFAGGRRVYKSPVSNYGKELNFSNIGSTSSGNPCGIYYDNINIYVTTEQQYNLVYVLNQSTGTLSTNTINLSDKWLYCGVYCSGLNKYMVSNHYNFWTSSDNISFTAQTGSGFYYLCSNGTVFVGCGSGGGTSALRYSTDGETFTTINSVGENDFSYSSVEFAHNKFVYTNGLNIWYSLDGITWDYLSALGISASTPFSISYGKCKILENSHPSRYIKFEHRAYGATTYYVFDCETNSWTSLTPIKENVSQFDYVGTGKSDFAIVNKSSVYAGTTSYYTNVFTTNFSYKLPAIPSDSGTYTLKAVNGVLQWVSN